MLMEECCSHWGGWEEKRIRSDRRERQKKVTKKRYTYFEMSAKPQRKEKRQK